jgi:hypothetical protein
LVADVGYDESSRQDFDSGRDDDDFDSDTASEDGGFFDSSVSSWDKQGDEESSDLAAFLLRVGSANSPSGHIGGQLEFYLTSSIPLTIAAGKYDSEHYLDKKFGQVRRHNTSIGTGLILGQKVVKLTLNTSLTRIKEKASKGEKKGPGIGVQKPSDKTIFGINAGIGVRFDLSKYILVNFDYGTFIPISGTLQSSFGGPIQVNKDGKPMSGAEKKESFSFGVGFKF